ncbi:MAG: SIMPL domain-containing protein [Candidatus Krumholzibacteriota bacterium]|nr:SIMPL domain-containing protein [Candidatus Krumholzibacteriota bacterium]
MQSRMICICVAMLSISAVWSSDVSGGEISAGGGAILQVAPEYARINFNIVSSAPEVEEATRQAAEIYQRVLLSLQDWDALNVRTGEFSVAPKWKTDRRGSRVRQDGYMSTYAIVIRVSDLLLVHDVIIGVTKSGVKNFHLSYHAEVTDSLQEFALTQAVHQARGRAQAMAAAAGGRLGKLVNVTSLHASTWLHRTIRSGGGMTRRTLDGPRVMPNSIIFQTSVSARWQLLNPDEIGLADPSKWDFDSYIAAPR